MYIRKISINHIIPKLILIYFEIDHKNDKTLSRNITIFLGFELEISRPMIDNKTFYP